VVEGALNAFLGNTKAGQEEKTEYFVYMHHNSIVRLDVKVGRICVLHHFVSDSFLSSGAGTLAAKDLATLISVF